MAIRLIFTVEDPDAQLVGYGAGALMRYERGTTSAGPWTEAGTVPLAADTTSYERWDDGGVPTSWYRSRFSRAVPTEAGHYSDYSAALTVADLAPLALVDRDEFRRYLGVEAEAADAVYVGRMLDALCAEYRRLCRRDLEGAATNYDEVYHLFNRQHAFLLRHVPVSVVTSINRVDFDATEDDAYDETDWRLEDTERGLVRLRAAPEYVRVVYTATGEVPEHVPMDILEWGKYAWAEAERGGLASYQTGADAENYFASKIGKPPSRVARGIMGLWRSAPLSGSGVV